MHNADGLMINPLFPSEQACRTANILIIDDEEADIRALEWALRQAQFPNFRSLTDPTRARDEFARFRPDLVLLDLHMPELDGFGVLKQLREATSAADFLPVLVLTGDSTAEMRSRALAAGATDFLGKPVDYTEVILRIKNLLQTRFLYRQAQVMQTQLETLTAKQASSPAAGPEQKL
jgi:putative two-component system response regulator